MVEVRQQTLAWMVVVEVRQGTLVVDGRGGGGGRSKEEGGKEARQLTLNLTTLTWQVGKNSNEFSTDPPMDGSRDPWMT